MGKVKNVNREDKKDAIKMLMTTANEDLDISFLEFIDLAKELAEEYIAKEKVEIYQEISPGLYRKTLRL
ncbi:hypothetical protein C7959_1086 [Orenia marismortui]|uniref:Uncharacterized protein n=1 Tax=Orenia marismortui TaxID=46469 RepID=A0A4R8H9A4_9FIRM|nr:hypothetical protein C7959_1086 [Orenia marismortui]